MFAARSPLVGCLRDLLERALVLCAFASFELPAGLLREGSEFVFSLCHARTMTRTGCPRNSRHKHRAAPVRHFVETC